MKKISLFLFILIIFNTKPVFALFNFPVGGVVKSAYTYSQTQTKQTQGKARNFLPGISNEKLPKFSNIAQNYKTYNQKKKQEEISKQKKIIPATAALPGKYIDINLATQTLTTFQDGVATYSSKISSGASRTPTPIGTWKILNKSSRAWSARYKLYMPYWMAITSQGHGIHELPEYPGGRKEGAASIGRAVSHGCVRLPVGAAKIIYEWSNVGDTVYIHR